MNASLVRLERVASLFSEGIESEPLSFAARRARREALLRSRLLDRLRRLGAVLAFAGRLRHAGKVAAALDFVLRERLVAPLDLPDPRQALSEPDGLCGLACDLSPATILEGCSLGLTLFAPIGSTSWWSPSARWTAAPGGLAALLPSTLAALREIAARPTADALFEDVAVACSRPDAAVGRLGFGPKLARAYMNLFDAGLAHSVEIVGAEGLALAGVFGLAVGRVFISQSCFGPPELVRAALVVLDRQLHAQGFVLHDAELAATPGAQACPMIEDLGFEPMPRQDFIALQRASQCGCGAPRWRLSFLEAAPPPKSRRADDAPSSAAPASLAA